ncbi:MAG: CRISPR-associated endonuclease Cas6 [Saprospiraceae bacterium]
MKSSIKSLFYIFDHPLQHHQLHDFRSQFKELKGLVYNRDDEGNNIYGYPSIQFRVHEGNAAVFAINKGADAIEKLVKNRSLPVISKELNHSFALNKLTGNNFNFYRLYRWIPLDERYFPNNTIEQLLENDLTESETDILSDHEINGHNGFSTKEKQGISNSVKPWNEMFMDEKVKSLEKILVSNIIEFAQGMNWQISKNKSLRVRLHDIHHVNKVKLYGKTVLSFDVTYASNVSLPDHLSLGRGKSVGYGWQLMSEHNDEMKKLLKTPVRSKAKVL